MAKKTKTSRTRKAPKRDYWRKQHHAIVTPLWDVTVGVYINMTEAEIWKTLAPYVTTNLHKQHIKELEGWDEYGRVKGRVFPFGGGQILLARCMKDNFRSDLNTLVHEVTHVVHNILIQRGVFLTRETEEVYAYMVGGLTEQILRKLW